jgi:hypothetical protein
MSALSIPARLKEPGNMRPAGAQKCRAKSYGRKTIDVLLTFL